MQDIREDILLDLITKRLSGELTESEKLLLEEWAGADATNRRLLNIVDNEDTLKVEMARWRKGNPMAAHAKWEAKEAQRKTLIFRIGGLSAAAVVAAILIGTKLLHPVPPSSLPATPTIAKVTPVLPGRNTAVLTLSNGKQILLDSAGNGDLAIQSKSKLVKGDGSLAYTSAGAGAGEEMAYNTLSTPKAGQFQLVLPDGSHVWLNNVSQIRYPVSFTGKDRTVELTGEAYFEIAKDITKPFIVKTGDLSVEVLGTSFNINAYTEEGAVRTTLLDGAVRVRKGEKTVRLTPDEQAVALGSEDLKVLKQVPAADIVSWKNGFFYFGKASLQVVMRQLARWYDVDVVYQGTIPTIEFAGKIDRSLPLKDLLQFLDKNQVHFELKGRTITVLP